MPRKFVVCIPRNRSASYCVEIKNVPWDRCQPADVDEWALPDDTDYRLARFSPRQRAKVRALMIDFAKAGFALAKNHFRGIISEAFE